MVISRYMVDSAQGGINKKRKNFSVIAMKQHYEIYLSFILKLFPKNWQKYAKIPYFHFSRVATFTALQWLLNQCDQPKFTFVFNAPLWSWVCGSRFSLLFVNTKLNLLPQTQLHSGALNTKVFLGWLHWLRSHCNAVKVATREKWWPCKLL